MMKSLMALAQVAGIVLLAALAGPVEATALGNVLVQARTAGAVGGSLESLRRLVADTQELAAFTPRPGGGGRA